MIRPQVTQSVDRQAFDNLSPRRRITHGTKGIIHALAMAVKRQHRARFPLKDIIRRPSALYVYITFYRKIQLLPN